MDIHEGTLVVVVLKARDLIDHHSFYKQDVYASVTLNGTTKKTHVDVKGGQHPVWDAELRIPIHKGEKDILEVKCWSKERKEDVLLGTGKVDISETIKTGEFDDWVSMSQEDAEREQRGSVYLEMTFYSNKPAPAPVAKPAPAAKPTPAPAPAPIPIPKYLLPSNGAPLHRRASKLSPKDRLSRPAVPSKDALPPIPIVAASSKATESAPLPSSLRAGPGGTAPLRSRLVSQPSRPNGAEEFPNPYGGDAPQQHRRLSASPPRAHPPSMYVQQPPQPQQLHGNAPQQQRRASGSPPRAHPPSMYNQQPPGSYNGAQPPLARGQGSYLPPQQQQQQQQQRPYMASPPQQPPHGRSHSGSFGAPPAASPPLTTPLFSFPEPSHTPAPYQPPSHTPSPAPSQAYPPAPSPYPQAHTPVQSYSRDIGRHRSPAPPAIPRRESDGPLQDPYLSARYSTPLPLPPGSQREESPKLPGLFPAASTSPPRHPPPKFTVSTTPPKRSLSPPTQEPSRERTPMIDERRLRELREAEERAKRAREQELKDAELAHQMLLDEEAAEEKRKAEMERARKEEELETARKLEQDRKMEEQRKQAEERRRQLEKEEEDRLRKEQEDEERRFKEQEENDMEMARRLDRELNEGALA